MTRAWAWRVAVCGLLFHRLLLLQDLDELARLIELRPQSGVFLLDDMSERRRARGIGPTRSAMISSSISAGVRVLVGDPSLPGLEPSRSQA